jgi:hypothetical protein
VGFELLVATVGLREKCAVAAAGTNITVNCMPCNRKIVIFPVVELVYLDISFQMISSDPYMF